MLTSKQKSDWVAALRSGEFEQGRTHLEKDGKFCCLGVLAKINGLSTKGIALLPSVHRDIDMGVTRFTECGAFQACLMPSFDKLGSLAELNDNGIPFETIANHIEQHLPTKD